MFAQTVPDGVLFFFPSYTCMEKLIERWQVSRACTASQNMTIR